MSPTTYRAKPIGAKLWKPGDEDKDICEINLAHGKNKFVGEKDGADVGVNDVGPLA